MEILNFATYEMNMIIMIKTLFRTTLLASVALLTMLIAGCKGNGEKTKYDTMLYQPKYAGGFRIAAGADSVPAIIVNNPWQGADSVEYTTRIEKPANRIVAMSSTFVAMLESLDAIDRIVGVSGKDFISSEALRQRGDKVVDVGYDTNVDFEQLVMLNPDMVLLYGVNGPSAIEGKLTELGIPFMYLGEYLEQSPLGKAEWVVAMGQLIGEREKAEALADSISAEYNALMDKAASVTVKPKVMINAPYGDSWWMPSATNYMAQLIADAGGDYIYKDNTGNASESIDIERAYMLMNDANVWINPGQAASLAQLKDMAPRFTDTGVYKSGNVYNNNRRNTAGGGNDFYESGVMHPDIVLKDLISVFHPGIFPDYTPVYYHRLK